MAVHLILFEEKEITIFPYLHILVTKLELAIARMLIFYVLFYKYVKLNIYPLRVTPFCQ